MSFICLLLDSALQHCCDVTEFPRLQGAVCSIPHRPWLPAQVYLQESRATSNTAVRAQLTGVSFALEVGLGDGVDTDDTGICGFACAQEQEKCVTVTCVRQFF